MAGAQTGVGDALQRSRCDDGCCAAEQAGVSLDPARRAVLNRRAKWLAQSLVVYNTAEFLVSVIAGWFAGSVALIGFGLDSLVEVTSGLIIVWQFRHKNPEEYEERALRMIAGAFVLLGVYVAYESISALVVGERPAPTIVGIIVAVLSIVIMPSVSYWQRRTGKELGSSSVVADSKQVLLCSLMSVALLVGLLGNALFHLWWLDPAVGVVIALLAFNEAREAWNGDACGCH